MRYAVVIEKAEGNYSAYVPDLPGCVATGANVGAVEAVEHRLREDDATCRVADCRRAQPGGCPKEHERRLDRVVVHRPALPCVVRPQRVATGDTVER